MKERLTELLKGGLKYNDNPLSYCHDEHVGELADHLLANGIIVPPCAVGDKVYWINRLTKGIETDIVIAIHQYEDGLSIATNTIGTKCTTTYGLKRFLEIMHFSKEEAEAALKEQQ
ncbi:MAG: hypothetical protein J6S14_10960 [Clostridia bacterium]|nr:hypothetical protein [Clostridia bacterium]